MKLLAMTLLFVVMTTSCNKRVTQADLDNIQDQMDNVSEVLQQAQEAVPELVENLERAEEVAQQATSVAGDSDLLRSIAENAQEAATAAREALAENAHVLTLAQEAQEELQEQLNNTEVGDPWWYVGGTALLSIAGTAFAAYRRNKPIADALKETVIGVGMARSDVQDVALDKAQSDNTKAIIQRIKLKGA